MRRNFYIGLAALITSAVLLGLAFLPKIGAYFLIASILTEIGSLSFLSAQKKTEKFPLLTAATVAAYVLLAFSALLFLGGVIYSAANS